MAIQFKEIKNKTEDLMEQGNEAQNNVTASKTRVSQAQSNLNSAMQELDRARETDEEGNPTGDVSAAQAKVNMAQNQLAASKRALVDAEKHLESVNVKKKGLAADIAAHNSIESSNLDKLKALKSRAFADSSNALTNGIAERLNEAEDARAQLLASIGIHEDAQRYNGGGFGFGVQTWGSVALGEINTAGAALDSRTSGNSEGTGGPVPLAVASPSNFVPVPSDFNSHPNEDIRNSFEYVDRNYVRSSPEWQENANRRVESLNFQIADLERRMEERNNNAWEIHRRMEAYLLIDETNTTDDQAYNEMWQDYVKCNAERSWMEGQRSSLVSLRDSISHDIDPSQVTTFRGFGGKDFMSAYDDCITTMQGNSVEGVEGSCGINGSVIMANQQWGTRLDEAYGIKWFTENDHCTTGESSGDNGGTAFTDRKAFLENHNEAFKTELTNEYGIKDTGTRLNLEQIESRFYAGDSCELFIKGQDLLHAGIDIESRRWLNPIMAQDKKEAALHNANRYAANHITNIVGFSIYDSGDIAGIWLNDTGYWAGGNRVFIPTSKFYEMQENTSSFSVEYARRMLS